MLQPGVEAPSVRSSSHGAQGDVAPALLPAAFSGAQPQKGDRAKELSFCWSVEYAFPLSVTDLGARTPQHGLSPRPGSISFSPSWLHQLFCPVFPASEDTLCHSNANGRHRWNMWLYFSTSAVCLQCFSGVLEEDTALVLFCEALEQFSSIVQYLHCSFWCLNPSKYD